MNARKVLSQTIARHILVIFLKKELPETALAALQGYVPRRRWIYCQITFLADSTFITNWWLSDLKASKWQSERFFRGSAAWSNDINGHNLPLLDAKRKLLHYSHNKSASSLRPRCCQPRQSTSLFSVIKESV